MSIRPINCVVAGALMLGLASVAAAQSGSGTSTSPTFELSAGYQYVHVPDQSFPLGFNIDGARHSGPWGLVGEVGWAHDSESDDLLGTDFSTNMWNYGVGGRWSGFGAKSVWPYAQLIVGGETAHSSADGGGVDESSTDTSFMLQPGVGATFISGDGWGIFGQVDYRRTFFDEDEMGDINNQFRVYFGVRMILD